MINMNEVFISRLLRFISDKNIHEIIEYLVDNVCENFEDRFDIFIRALAAEQQFLHANGKNGLKMKLKNYLKFLN